MPNTTITAPKGFRAAALHVGIKTSSKPDLAVLTSDVPAAAAALFTTNKVVGAPVIVGRRHIAGHTLRACVVNSGCANVCTGQRGLDDAMEMCRLTAQGIPDAANSSHAKHISRILPFSTGVIGRFLPMDKIRAGIPKVIARLDHTAAAGEAFAQGILTTDLVKKTAHATLTLGGKKVTIAGCCKGSGMIAPNMATMLAFVTTDAAVHPRLLHTLIKQVADQTFNCVTVDQHTSTSDTLAIMANGLAGNRPLNGGRGAKSPTVKKFATALLEVCDSLSRQIARDGEGATKLVRVIVTGAESAADAKRAAEAIANSALVKTAIHGADPNWGRFVSAAGYSGAQMLPDRAACKVGPITVFKNGQPTAVNLASVEKIMRQENLDIAVDLGTKGRHSHRMYTCDLSREYIRINADYHT